MKEEPADSVATRAHSDIAHRLECVGEAATLQMANRARQLKAEGRSIISLSTGEPDFPTPQNIKDAAVRAIEENFTKYTAAQGMLELRQAVANKFRRENNIDTTAERIQVSSGSCVDIILAPKFVRHNCRTKPEYARQ